MKDKYRARLAKIEAEIKSLQDEQTAEQKALDDLYDFPPGFWDYFDYSNMYSDENASNYLHTQEEIRLKYENLLNILSAKWAALFLIATHIARKNRPLHADTATRKLEKYGEAGNDVILQMELSDCLPMFVNGHAYLHGALYRRHGVKLLDEHYACYLMSEIKHNKMRLAQTRNPILRKNIQKQIDKHTKELAMFHRSIIADIKAKIARANEIAF